MVPASRHRSLVTYIQVTEGIQNIAREENGRLTRGRHTRTQTSWLVGKTSILILQQDVSLKKVIITAKHYANTMQVGSVQHNTTLPISWRAQWLKRQTSAPLLDLM